MDLLVCGTAAAEAWPALFCRCEVCAAARRLGGKNLRGRSGYVLGEKIKIDFGPDACAQMLQYGLAYEKLTDILVTHAHEDHWTPHELGYRRPGFSLVPEDALLTIHGNAQVCKATREAVGDDLSQVRLSLDEVQPWKPIPLSDGITATAILADHDGSQMCVNYLIQAEGRCLLIGHDTGWWPEETWEFLKGVKLDLALMDCTYGRHDNQRGHLSCSWVVRTRDRLAEQGSLNHGCRFYATHFSHNGGWLHEELEAYFTPVKIRVAYDGLVLPL